LHHRTVIEQSGRDREAHRLGHEYCPHEHVDGEYGWHEQSIKNVRLAAKKAKATVGILVDLQGPKIRVGKLPDEGVNLVSGDTVIFSTDSNDKLPKYIPSAIKNCMTTLSRASGCFLTTGFWTRPLFPSRSPRYGQDRNPGLLKSNKGMNLPDSNLQQSSITAKDVSDAKFAVKMQANWVALSFVRSAADVLKLRKLLGNNKLNPKIIVKIEKPQAVANFDAILEATDAVMVARGDLGVEIPAEQVPVVQKTIAASASRRKPVIVATQMLDSMIRNPRPTRAEVPTLPNAVIRPCRRDHAFGGDRERKISGRGGRDHGRGRRGGREVAF